MGQRESKTIDTPRPASHFLPVLAIILGLAGTAALGRLASATWSLMQETAPTPLIDHASSHQYTGEAG